MGGDEEMSAFFEALQKRKQEYEEIIKRTKPSAGKACERLRISKVRNNNKYYLRPAGSKQSEEKYCKSSEIERVKAAAQLDYEKRLYEIACRQLERILKFERDYDDDALVALYSGMAASRKQLIRPVIPDEETYANLWKAAEYTPKSFEEGTAGYLTENGEKVRSKSEKIIADRYLKLDIPYRYECPLRLIERNNVRIIYPDFTLLNKRTRQIYYHEHFGMMDNPAYCEKALKKLALYQNNGIYPGEKLLLTFETSGSPLDLQLLSEMITKYLL